MINELQVDIKSITNFKEKLLCFGNKHTNFLFLDSSNFTSKNTNFSYYEYDFVAAIGCKIKCKIKQGSNFNQLKEFNNHKEWIFGFLSYDLKNEIENLESKNIDELNFPVLHFFIPEYTIVSKQNNVSVYFDSMRSSTKDIDKMIHSIENEILINNKKIDNLKIEQRFSKQEYVETVKKLKKHIQLGDIYEINFCNEFYSRAEINPLSTYLNLKETSPTPFSCYLKLENKYLLSASPERFIKKKGSKIISQPIKGTIKRGSNSNEDQKLKDKLYNDPKERAENVMIVDLVRNDLSKTASKASVKVEELFGVYSFTQVHQLISTVVSEVDSNTNAVDIIKNAFPMGSMTGAPKVMAMKLIEKYEKTKRGLYSGAVGFITPEKDFDFNVVIRSILYNELNNYVSFTVGGAITSLAKPEKEYDECLVKAKAMINVLKPE